MLHTAYYEFVAAFREAAMKLRHGDRLVRFPAGAAFDPLQPSHRLPAGAGLVRHCQRLSGRPPRPRR